MAQTAKSPTLVQAIGSFTNIVVGAEVATTGTTTVVTVPQLSVVEVVIVGGAESATAPYCDTVSGNTFTVTHGSAEDFTYVAFGKAKV